MSYDGQVSPGEPWHRRGRMPMVLAVVAAYLLLALIGAAGGVMLADSQSVKPPLGASSPTSVAPSITEPSASTSRSPTRRVTEPAVKPSGMGNALPDLVGQDFVQARDELRDRSLGVNLIFSDFGDSRQVVRTDPAPGTPVAPGRTVKVYVAGAPPVAMIPHLVGQSCSAAAARLGKEGLYPRYPTGKTGTVTEQDPLPDGEGRWNDKVAIYCGSTSTASPTSSVSLTP